MKPSHALSGDERKRVQRTGKRSAAERRVFLDRLEAAMTDEVMERAYRYARKRCNLLSRCGMVLETALAKHLLADAISDTALEKAHWDPDRCELYVHLHSVIRYRTKDMLARAQKQQHERLFVVRDEDERTGLEAQASERVGAANAEDATVRMDLVTQVAGMLYASVTVNSDPIVARILDAYAAGVTGRREVAEHAGLSLKQFDAARNRLDRLVAKLPEQLAADAADSIGVRR